MAKGLIGLGLEPRYSLIADAFEQPKPIQIQIFLLNQWENSSSYKFRTVPHEYDHWPGLEINLKSWYAVMCSKK